MRIIVDGKEAVLKAGSSFEYISENPLFTEAEGYSLEIEFPLKDCPENILIFGALHVKGVDISKVTFPCELDAGTFRKSGFLTIVEVNEAEVKGQFLEGMSTSQFEFDALKVYIDEIDYSIIDGSDGVAEHVANAMGNDFADIVVWDKEEDALFTAGNSYYFRHIYLHSLIEWVAYFVGMDVDYGSGIDLSWFNNLVVVNTTKDVTYVNNVFPDAPTTEHAKNFMRLNKTLPHWTVREFLEEVGKFFGCQVVFDMLNKKAKFVKYRDYLNPDAGTVSLVVNDDFIIEQQDSDDKVSSIGKVKLPDECNQDNLNMCPIIEDFFDDNNVRPLEKDAFNRTLVDYATTPTGTNWYKKEWMYGVKYVYDFYIGKAMVTSIEEREDIESMYHYKETFVKFEMLDQYGDCLDGSEVKIVPCNLDIKGLGFRFTQYGYRDVYYSPTVPHPYKVPVIDIQKPKYGYFYDQGWHLNAQDILKLGTEGEETKYEKLYVVLHSGTMHANGYQINTRMYEPEAGTEYAQETIDAVGVAAPVYYKGFMQYNVTITPADEDIRANVQLPSVDETQLYRYKFLGTTIPSPTSIFLINGQKFACLRFKAHFTVDGMSELIEGEFYRIIG